MSFTSAHAQTPDSVKTRIGTLNFERGFPTEETTRKLYDEMDFQRAVQAFLWSFPAVSFESIRVGVKRDLGADLNDLIIADNFADTRGIWLTANDTTIYGMVNVDLSQGPIVLEVPAGPGVGLIDDFWQRAITDFGLPGPDKGKGGKYLLLPPGYTGEVPKEGYFVLRGTMNNYNIMNRGLVENNDIAAAVNLIKSMRVYPWSQRDNPKANKVVSMSGPTMERFRPTASNTGRGSPRSSTTTLFTSATASSWPCSSRWGSRKARSSSPMRGNAPSSRTPPRLATRWRERSSSMLSSASATRSAFPGTHWVWVVLMDHDQETDTYSQLDERLHYFYGAIYMSPAIGRKTAGPGASYIQAFADKDGNHFDGGKSYRLHLPANIPVSSFWSLTLYDTETRSMIQNPPNDSARSGYDKLKTNADGSIDLYFGPKAPRGPGEQLDPDASRQRLLPVLPLLRPQGGRVRRDMEDAGRRVDEVGNTEMRLTLFTKWSAPNAAKASLTSVLLGIAGLVASPLHAQEISDDWQFAATIYGWLPDIGGHTELPLGGGGSIGVDVSTILDHLKMTAMGSFEIQKGHWGAFTDVIYLDVGDSNSRTRNLSIDGVPFRPVSRRQQTLTSSRTIWTLAGSYRVVGNGEATFDVLAGARLAHMDRTSSGPSPETSARSRRRRAPAVATHPSISGMRSSGARGESRLVRIAGGRCRTTLTSAPATPTSPGRRSSA